MIGRGGCFGGLRRHRGGSAAVEFALIAPVMIIMVLGMIEVVQAIRIQAKLNVAAGQLVEMIAGQSSVTTGSINGTGGSLGDMCTAASYNLYPFDTSTLSGYIESTTVNQGWGGVGTGQDWAADRSCPTARPTGSFNETILLTSIANTPRSLFTIDGSPPSGGGSLVKGYSAISLQLTYVYSNVLPYLMGPSITFTAVASSRPRSNTAVSCTYPVGAASAPCPGVY